MLMVVAVVVVEPFQQPLPAAVAAVELEVRALLALPQVVPVEFLLLHHLALVVRELPVLLLPLQFRMLNMAAPVVEELTLLPLVVLLVVHLFMVVVEAGPEVPTQ